MKKEKFLIHKNIYLESTPQELSNNWPHHDESWLQEKLDINLFCKKTAETAITGEADMEKTVKK